jgi:alanine-synthesizing transaminase
MDTMRFSSRVPGDLEPNRLARLRADLHARGVPILDLTMSNPTAAGLAFDDRVLDALASPGALVYEPEPFGLRSARRAVAADFARRGRSVDPDRIVLTASTSEAYAYLFKLMCEPGDTVLVPAPSYPLFDHLAALEGVRPVPYPLDAHDGWALDAEAVASRLSPVTRAIVVVSPNNPTGTFLTRPELDALAAICADRGLALVGDEVFFDYPLDACRSGIASVLDQAQALSFCLGGLSKSAGLPQVKLGWIAAGGPDALVARALVRLEIVADTYLSVSAPVQHAAPAFIAGGAQRRAAIHGRVADNLEVLRRLVVEHPACQVGRVEGGWAAVVQVPRTEGEEALVLRLLEEDRVLVHPGYFFDFPHEAFVVLSLLPEPHAFLEGVGRVLARADA